MFSKRQNLVVGLFLFCLLAKGAISRAVESEAELLATLKSNEASYQNKTAACKRLAVVGTEAAVPVLAGMLDDETLAHYARYGLEPIPSDQVDEVLLAALDKTTGQFLIGVIQSLGNRGKASAISAIAKKLDDKDREVAKAAAHCIARLGTEQAGEILTERLSGEFAPAGLRCGKQLAKQGHTDAAVELLMKVFQLKEAEEYVQHAAMLQVIESQRSKGLWLLKRALYSDDPAMLDMGLRMARRIDPDRASQVATQVLMSAKPAKSALLITLLGDLGEDSSLSTVVEIAQGKVELQRIAALRAISRLGGAGQVEMLLRSAGDKSAAVAAAAMETLVALQGDDVDRIVLEKVNDRQLQAMAIKVVGQRRIAAAVPMLVEMLGDSGNVDLIAALGETVSLEQLDIIGDRLGSESAETREAVAKALHAACYRMPNRKATVEKLVGYLEGAAEDVTSIVMEELRQVGGPEALAVVAGNADSEDELRRDYATRVLGEWLDTSAAPVLLKLAQEEGGSKYGIRAIKGYIRLARQFSMPGGERVKMCRTALNTATRPAEKMLVLEVLERYPSLGTLKVAVEATGDDQIREDAIVSARKVAAGINGNQEKVKALLAKLPEK